MRKNADSRACWEYRPLRRTGDPKIRRFQRKVTLLSAGGTLNFVYPPELFPTALRATVSGLATSVSRIGSVLGAVAFPNMVAAWGDNAALWVFAAVGLAGLLICVFMAPETKGRALEEINATGYAPEQDPGDHEPAHV